MKFFIVTEAGISCDPARQGTPDLGSIVKELGNGRKAPSGVSTAKLAAVGEDATMVLVNLRPNPGTIIRIDPGFNKAKGVKELSRCCVPFSEGVHRRRHSAWFFSLEPGAHLQFQEVEQLDGHLGETTRLYSILVTADGQIQFDPISLSNTAPEEEPSITETRPIQVGPKMKLKAGGDRRRPVDCICSLGGEAEGEDLLVLCIHEK